MVAVETMPVAYPLSSAISNNDLTLYGSVALQLSSMACGPTPNTPFSVLTPETIAVAVGALSGTWPSCE
jgi:hypothetical protein